MCVVFSESGIDVLLGCVCVCVYGIDVLLGCLTFTFLHSTCEVCSRKSFKVNFFFACVRDIRRPAPWAAEQNDSGFPLPRTMNELAPMLPGMIPASVTKSNSAQNI